MKIALTILSTLTLFGCSQENVKNLPTSGDLPVRPDNSPAWLWAMVIEESGVCIPGATATVVSGQGLGQSFTQTTPCDAWAYDGGIVLKGLTPGVAMTLRASAPGYVSEEKTVVPSLGPQMAVDIVLHPIR